MQANLVELDYPEKACLSDQQAVEERLCSLAEAVQRIGAQLLKDRHIGGVPVVNEEGHVRLYLAFLDAACPAPVAGGGGQIVLRQSSSYP
jgi:hypothetical protein